MPIDFWTVPNLAALPNVAHGFTRRTGGVSKPPFDTLNLGLHVGDNADAVRENRSRVARAFSLDLTDMVCAAQVHGGAVAVVTRADGGRGAADFADAIPGVDALVTNVPNLLLSLFFADCVPVFFVDTVQNVVAVAHAGWRGLVAGVLDNTLATMQERFGTRPGDVQAAIGACIGTAQFEVGAEVAAHFPAETTVAAFGNPHVNLVAATLRRLTNAGVPPAQIIASGECTASNSLRYFSHRAEAGRTGRMGAFIVLLP